MAKDLEVTPRKDTNRFGFLDVFRWINGESLGAYTPEMLKQREKLIELRPKALYPPAGQFWEVGTSTFKDPTKGGWFSWLWSDRHIPTQALDKTHFYVKDDEQAHYERSVWNSFLDREKEVAEYVLEREKDTDLRRQNHPLNFFYKDVQDICHRAAEETDPHQAEKVRQSLVTYLTRARKAKIVPLLDRDRFFVDDMVSRLKIETQEETKGSIEAESLGGDFRKLGQALSGLHRRVRDVLQKSGDEEVAIHVVLDKKGAHPKKYPGQALIACAEEKEAMPDSTALVKQGEALSLKTNPLLKEKDGVLKPDTELLDVCPTPFDKAATQERKEHYIRGLSHVVRLNTHMILNNVVRRLHQFGGNLNLALVRETISGYLTELRVDVQKAVGDVNELVKVNEALKREYFAKKGKASWFAAQSLTEAEEAFLKNQEVLEEILGPDKELDVSPVEEAIDAIEKRLNFLGKGKNIEELAENAQDLFHLFTDVTDELGASRIDETPSKTKDNAKLIDNVGPQKVEEKSVAIKEEGEEVPPIPESHHAPNATKSDIREAPRASKEEGSKAEVEAHSSRKAIGITLPRNVTATDEETGRREERFEASLITSTSEKEKEAAAELCSLRPTLEREIVDRQCVEVSVHRREGGESAGNEKIPVVPKAFNVTKSADPTADMSDVSTLCKIRPFTEKESYQCEARRYEMPYQAQLAETVFNQVGGQAALAGVFYQMGKDFYQWWTTKPEEIEPIDELAATDLFRACHNTLDEIQRLNSTEEDKWVTQLVEDYRDELSDKVYQHKKQRLSKEMLEDTNANIDYLKDSVTVVTDRSIIEKEVSKFSELLSQSTGLLDEELKTLETYFKTVSEQRRQFNVELDDAMVGSYQALANKSHISQAILLDIAQTYFMINNLLNDDSTCKKSDLIDARAVLEGLIPLLEERIDEYEVDVREDIGRLRNRANVWYPEAPQRLKQPVFFQAGTKPLPDMGASEENAYALGRQAYPIR